jgi:hypothetical protein
MPLPIKPLATEEVEIAGTMVPIRSMNRPAVIKLGSLEGDNEAAEILMLMAGTQSSAEDVAAFREGNDAATVEVLVEAIARLSGIRSMTPLRCPECGHEDAPDAFVVKDGAGDPKSPASRRSSSARS